MKIDQNFVVASKLDEMDDKAKKVNLYSNFPNKLNKEGVVICKTNKNIISNFLYCIRCALAHGIFLVKDISKSKYIILENVSKREKCINARMVIKVESLVKLKKLILDGDKGYIKYIEDKDVKIINDAKKVLEENEIMTQKEIKNILKLDYKKINSLCQKYNYKIEKIEDKYQIHKENK